MRCPCTVAPNPVRPLISLPAGAVPAGASASDIIEQLVGARPMLDPELVSGMVAGMDFGQLDGMVVAELFGIIRVEPPSEEELAAARARLRSTIARLEG